MENIIYTNDLSYEVVYPHYRNVFNNYTNLLEFSEQLKNFNKSRLLIYRSSMPFVTEMNYRRVLANIFIFVSGGGFCSIVDSIKDERFNMILRSVRCLGLADCIDLELNGDEFVLTFNTIKIDNRRLVYNNIVNGLETSLAVKQIAQSIEEGKSFSLVRVGHCEVKFVAYNYMYGQTDLTATCKMQWGVESICEDYFQFVRQGLIESISKSTYVGFNLIGNISSQPKKILENSVTKALADFSLINGNQIRISPNFHWELALSKEFFFSLKFAKRIVLITSRVELQSTFKNMYPNIDIVVIPVPGEYKIDGAYDISDRFLSFKRIDEYISKISSQGVVFLIGAGVAGKRFISTAIKNNSTALDLGSALDAWAGVDSRGDGFKGKYKNFVDNLSLS